MNSLRIGFLLYALVPWDVNYKLSDKRVTAFLFGFAAVELEVNFCSLLQHLFERQTKQKLCTLFTTSLLPSPLTWGLNRKNASYI